MFAVRLFPLRSVSTINQPCAVGPCLLRGLRWAYYLHQPFRIGDDCFDPVAAHADSFPHHHRCSPARAGSFLFSLRAQVSFVPATAPAWTRGCGHRNGVDTSTSSRFSCKTNRPPPSSQMVGLPIRLGSARMSVRDRSEKASYTHIHPFLKHIVGHSQRTTSPQIEA